MIAGFVLSVPSQMLKQELKSLHSLSKDLSEKIQEKYKTSLKEVLSFIEKQHINNTDVNRKHQNHKNYDLKNFSSQKIFFKFSSVTGFGNSMW